MKLFVLFSLALTFTYMIFEITTGLKKVSEYSFMDRSHTNIIRAIAILMVLWGHVGANLGVQNIQFIGGIGVTLFLFLSGYGLFTSYEKNMYRYGIKLDVKDYWKKKFTKIILPFWIVEISGLLLIGKFNFYTVIKDLLFLNPATSYGWYMQYLIICYFIFWLVIQVKELMDLRSIYVFYFLIGSFIIWFVIDSLFFANPDMPFLRARQMLAFPLGVGLSYYLRRREKINYFLKNNIKIQIVYSLLGIILGMLITLVTQLDMIKSLPYLESNIISLFTVLPMGLSIIVITNLFQKVFKNSFLFVVGTVSYEIYLVHAFTLNIIDGTFIGLAIFLLATIVAVSFLFFIQKVVKKRLLLIVSK